MNKAIVVGRLTKDIELKKTNSGLSVTQFSLACNRTKEDTDFIDCVAWRQSADYLSSYAKKGDRIGVVGRIQTRTYQDKQGMNRKITEVVAENVELYAQKSTNKPISSDELIENEVVITEDDLPF